MKIASMEKITLLDYPGKVACIIFTQGCNLGCPFCQNSTLIPKTSSEEITEEEVFKYLGKRKNILDGVCISGGEPLLQQDIKDFIIKIKQLGYKVKLDTNGGFPDKLKDLIDSNLLDYVAMDIKESFNKYEEITGIKNINTNNIMKSIDILKNSNVEYEFRTTIVKEFHTIDDIKEVCSYIGTCSKHYIQNFQDSDNVLKKGLHGFTHNELVDIQNLNSIYPNLCVRGI